MKEEDYEIYQAYISNRIDKLIKENLFFEIIFWFSNILEGELKDVILTQ